MIKIYYNYFSNTNNIPFSPYSPFIQNGINTNSINIQKNQTNLLNKKTSRENSKESINKKNKIFGIIKIKIEKKKMPKNKKENNIYIEGVNIVECQEMEKLGKY